MSLATWMAEFYPTPASECPESEAVAHSLRKWRGLLPKNLDRHGVMLDDCMLLCDGDFLPITGDSCSLCVCYYKKGNCGKCPLFSMLGGHCADPGMPFKKFEKTNNPLPMIAALEATLAAQGGQP